MSQIGIRLILDDRARLFGLIVPIMLSLAACSEKKATDPRTEPPMVRAAIVEGAVPASRAFTGTVAARVQSDLGFRVSGKVLSRLVDVGQTVKRGQPLMRIDSIDLKLAVAAQEQAVAAAKALAQQTADDEERYRDLRGTGAVSGSTYDRIKTSAESAKAQLSAAEAQADVARNASSYTELLADSDGVVMETLAGPGQIVSAGQPVVRLARSGPREAIIQLPETFRPSVGSVGQAILFGRNGVSAPATLRQLSDSADRATRTFEARYVLDGQMANAPLGTTVTIQTAGESSPTQGGLQVPIGALVDMGKGPGVWVISGDPASVAWKPVVIQSIDEERARIAGQVKQGDQIVALGAHLLREGELVRVLSKTAVGATKGAHP